MIKKSVKSYKEGTFIGEISILADNFFQMTNIDVNLQHQSKKQRFLQRLPINVFRLYIDR